MNKKYFFQNHTIKQFFDQKRSCRRCRRRCPCLLVTKVEGTTLVLNQIAVIQVSQKVA